MAVEISFHPQHYNDVIMSAMASQITGLTIVYSTDYSGAAQRKHQSSASLAFGRGIHRWPVNSPHKGLTARKMFPFDDVILENEIPRKFITRAREVPAAKQRWRYGYLPQWVPSVHKGTWLCFDKHRTLACILTAIDKQKPQDICVVIGLDYLKASNMR